MDGWTEDELAREVIVTPRRGLVPLDDTRVIERPGWFQVITPSLREGGLNEVGFCKLAVADADRVIDATLDEYAKLGISVRWLVDPWSEPADLAARLEARGLKRSITRCMYAPVAELARDTGGDGVTVERVTPETAELFATTMAAAWSMTNPTPLVRHAHLMLASTSPRSVLFIARHDGVPAGTAGVVLFPRSAYLIGAAVKASHRGRGLYRALVAARVAVAHAEGIGLATIQANAETSAPIAARLGFRTLCDLPLYWR